MISIGGGEGLVRFGKNRYEAKVIDEPGYPPRVIQYIHLKPVRAVLAEDPSKYTFNGHRELIWKISKPLCDVDETLLCFGPTQKTARRSYSSSLRIPLKEEGLAEEVGELPWWTPDREFSVTIETIDKALSELATRQKKHPGRNKIQREKTKNR